MTRAIPPTLLGAIRLNYSEKTRPTSSLYYGVPSWAHSLLGAVGHYESASQRGYEESKPCLGFLVVYFALVHTKISVGGMSHVEERRD